MGHSPRAAGIISRVPHRTNKAMNATRAIATPASSTLSLLRARCAWTLTVAEAMPISWAISLGVIP